MHQYQVSLIIGIIIYLLILIVSIVMKKINIQYSVFWFLAGIIMLVLAIFPEIITNLASFMGIASPMNLILVLQGFFVLLIVMYLTSLVSQLSNRLNRLTQNYALMENRLNELEALQKEQCGKIEPDMPGGD